MEGFLLKRKMKCPKNNELIAYMAGELSIEQTETVRKHIQVCKKCAMHLLISRMFQALGKHRNIEPLKLTNHNCFDNTTLSDFVSGRSMTKSIRNQVVEHLAQCNSCRVKSVKLFQEYSNLASERQEFLNKAFDGTSRSKANWWSRIFSHIHTYFPDLNSLRWAMIGTAIIIFVAITFVMTWRSAKQTDIWINPKAEIRGGENSIQRRFVLKTPENSAMVNQENKIHFSWPKIPGALKYKFFIYASNGEVVHEMITESCEIEFDSKRILQSGQTYFWQVEMTSQTTQPFISELRSFTIE